MAAEFGARARHLRNAVEPVAAGVYFGPEAHAAYEALGFDGSPVAADGVARPELKSYFTSRGACMGRVTGEVVAAAFGVVACHPVWWGLPARACTPSRGWTAEDMDSGFQRLQRRGLMTTDERLTDAGRAFREEIEVGTDELERPLIDALGDDLDELLEFLDPWSEAIIDAGSYPQRIAGVYNVRGGPALRLRADPRHRGRALREELRMTGSSRWEA